MPQVLNSDVELAGKRLHTSDAALTNTFAGLSTLTGSTRLLGQPVCLLRHSTTQSIATSSDTALTFNTELHDIGAMHDAVNPTRVTIPSGQDGIYLISGNATFAVNATGIRRLQFIFNGVTTRSAQQVVPPASANGATVSTSMVSLLAAGDYVEVMAFQSSGVSLDVGSALGNFQTQLMVVKLA